MKFKKIIFVDKFEKNHDVSVSNEGNQLKSGISNESKKQDNNARNITMKKKVITKLYIFIINLI